MAATATSAATGTKQTSNNAVKVKTGTTTSNFSVFFIIHGQEMRLMVIDIGKIMVAILLKHGSATICLTMETDLILAQNYILAKIQR